MVEVARHTFKDGRKLIIVRDPDPENPRSWDNVGTMICLHSHYRLGDLQEKDLPRPLPERREDWAAYLQEHYGAELILPLYFHNHGMQIISTSSFAGRAHHAEWDSCQVGWIIATQETIDEHGGPEQTKKLLEGEVEVCDQYLLGDVYGYRLMAADCPHCGGDGEELESCWGFYGDDPLENGIADHLPKELQQELQEQQKGH